jgi:hypothetical protein
MEISGCLATDGPGKARDRGAESTPVERQGECGTGISQRATCGEVECMMLVGMRDENVGMDTCHGRISA